MKNKTQIVIQGQIDEKWIDWFDESEIEIKENKTILSINVKDEAHMHGILNKIRDLNLKLVSVNPANNISDNE